MPARPTKTVRSYRLVFRRRWRIFRLERWRIPLPGGLELRLIGYWLAALAALALLARLPLLGAPLAAAPPALRLLAAPLACAWALSRWEPDGRAPHRALAGALRFVLAPRSLAAGRRVPAIGSELVPLAGLLLAPDLTAPTYPRGRVLGPARLLLRYPASARRRGRRLTVAPAPGPPLHRGRRLEVPAGALRQLRGPAPVRPPPLIDGNLLLRSPSEAWALYELAGQSYPGLPDARKVEVGERLEALAYTLEADFQILRVARDFDAAAYERRALATLDPRHGRREAFARHLAEGRAAIEARGALRPQAYLAVRLGPPAGAPLAALGEGLGGIWRALAERAGIEGPAAIGADQLAAHRAAEEAAFERVLAYLDAERIGPQAIAALFRRAYTRGLGEPDVDQSFRPRALAFLDPGGERRFRPAGYELLRLHESRLRIERRSLAVDCERGRAHQAQLVLGALPEEAAVPGPAAELMFAPLELGFGVDATLSVSHLPNREARRLVARRKVDADQIAREEEAGEHGPSAAGAERPALARELEAVLGGGERPPLLRAALLLSLGAPDARDPRAAGRAPARGLRPHPAAPPRGRAAPALLRQPARRPLPAARVHRAPAARPDRGDGPARGQPRRLRARPLLSATP